MTAPDLRLYLVTGAVPAGADLGAVVSAAVAGGVTIVQVRDKSVGTRGLARLARDLDVTVPVVVNDDLDAAAEAATGVHLGPDDAHPVEARARLGADVLIGWSMHDLAQLADAAALEAVDYLAASPVWATPTKLDTTEPLGLHGVRALRDAMPPGLPLVAIGGIDKDNAASVIEAGADGVAVVSAVCSAPDPAAAARELRQVVDGALTRRTNR